MLEEQFADQLREAMCMVETGIHYNDDTKLDKMKQLLCESASFLINKYGFDFYIWNIEFVTSYSIQFDVETPDYIMHGASLRLLADGAYNASFMIMTPLSSEGDEVIKKFINGIKFKNK